MPGRPTARHGISGCDVTDNAQAFADRLAQFAIMATELGHTHGCSVQLRLDSRGLLVVAKLRGSDWHAATLVPWSEVLARNGAVTAAMHAMVAEVGEGRGQGS